MSPTDAFSSIEVLLENLSGCRYVADRSLATVLYLSHHLKKPIFLEGEPGVGKTEVALVLSLILDTRLIRLQCYEGLDACAALYEWNYTKQLLRIKMEEQCNKDPDAMDSVIYSLPYLIKRPLLDAIQSADKKAPVLLIDELDRADEEFEAFLLEILSGFQISIPEIGTLRATHTPFVVVTSNRTREVHDALKRRCLYHWIDYPDREKELQIVRTRVPGITEALSVQIVRFMQDLRSHDFLKRPGVSETLDWAEALIKLHTVALDRDNVEMTLGCILKHREDMVKFRKDIWADPNQQARLLSDLSPGLC